MTPLDIAALKALMEKATPRPWGNDACAIYGRAQGDVMMVCAEPGEGAHGKPFWKDNRALIVAAVNALPALLAELEEFQQTFDLIHDSDMRAIKMWQAEKPEERKLMWPDRAKMILWLLFEKKPPTLEARVREVAREALCVPVDLRLWSARPLAGRFGGFLAESHPQGPHAMKSYHSFRWWIRWFVPMPLLIRISKRNFVSHVWYQDDEVQIEMVRGNYKKPVWRGRTPAGGKG